MGRVGAIVQARMGSTRLPGKVLARVAGRPLLEHVVRRTRAARLLDEVLVATTTSAEDDEIVRWCEENGVPSYRGSVDDVLDRYCSAARRREYDPVVRITADCPLIDPALIDHAIEAYQEGNHDYVTNALEPTFPDGLDVEVFSAAALQTAHQEARLASEREHVTAFIINHPERFRMLNLKNNRDLGGLRWTVDEPADLRFVEAVYQLAQNPDVTTEGVLALMRQHPELAQLNANIPRNEGYLRSLQKDRLVQPGGRNS